MAQRQIDEVALLTVKEVAELLKLHERTVWRMSVMGEIPRPVKIGSKAQRWRLSDLQSFINGGAHQ